jgi:hypothetical protein
MRWDHDGPGWADGEVASQVDEIMKGGIEPIVVLERHRES